jgi:hypothetical protein
MPKPKKPQPIMATIVAFLPRTDYEIMAEVEIDPNHLELSDKPTVKEINKVAEQVLLSKLKTKVTSDGRTLIADIGRARAAAKGAAETK